MTLLTLQEMSAASGVAIQTLRRWVVAGRITADETKLARNQKGDTFLFVASRADELRAMLKPKPPARPKSQQPVRSTPKTITREIRAWLDSTDRRGLATIPGK